MKEHPSQALLGLLDALQTAKSESRQVAAINYIGDLAEWAALPFLLGWIHHENSLVRSAAADAAAALMRTLTPEKIISLELLVRASWARFNSHGALPRATTLSALLLASLDPNGRIRELSLRKLQEVSDLAVLPYMLLRLNDWVPVVRRLAHDWFARHSAALPAAALLGVIPVIAALMDRSQAAASGPVAAILERLRATKNTPDLIAAIPSAKGRTLRFIFDQLRAYGALADGAVQQALVSNSDPFIGMLCLDGVLKGNTPISRAVLDIAAVAKSAMLRAKALQIWQSRQMEGLDEMIERGILDESPFIRLFARYWLKQMKPGIDFCRIYMAAIPGAGHRKTAAAIMGFHECGGRWEPAEYNNWLQSPHVIERRAALRCYVANWPDAAQPLVQQLAVDGSDPSLRELAFRIIKKKRGWLPLDEIVSLLFTNPEVPIRKKALGLLRRQEKWRQLPVLLRLLAGNDTEMRPSAVNALRDWQQRFNLSWTQPAENLVIEARHWLSAAAPGLGKRQAHDLENLLSTVVCGKDG